jgi:hypothetical protein
MSNAIEAAVDTYIRAWSERDPALREKLLEACFAADGRLVTRWRVIRGRDALMSLLGPRSIRASRDVARAVSP